MCLAIPGRIVEVSDGEGLERFGVVDLGGSEQTVNLAMVPEAAVGDYIVTHAGFALHVVPSPETPIPGAESRDFSPHARDSSRREHRTTKGEVN